MSTHQILDENFREPLSLFKGIMSLPNNISNSADLVVATVLINLLSLALPLTLMQTYDRIIPNRAIGSLTWLVIGCLIAIVFEFIVRTCRAFISDWMAARFEHMLSCSAVDKLLMSNLKAYERFSVGTHMDRMNAVYTLRRFYAGQLFQVILDLPFSFIFLFAVWFLGKWLVLVPVIATVLLFLIVFVSRIGFRNSSKRVVAVNEKRFDFVFKLLSRIHIVKSMTLEEQMLRRHEGFQEDTAEAVMGLAGWSMLPSNAGAFFSQLTIFSVIIVGAINVIGGSVTLGIVTACSMMSSRAIQPLQNAISFWLRFTEAKIAKSRLQEIADLEPECIDVPVQLPGEIEGHISFRNVSFRDTQAKRALLEEVFFSVRARETVGVTCETSNDLEDFFLLMTGRLQPDSGDVFVDSYNIHEWDFSNLKGKIEYIPKKGTLFKGTIMENLTLFDPVRSFAATGVAQLLEIDRDVALLPEGYQTMVSHQTTFLSAGLIQRIALARALVIRPRILLVDYADTLMDKQSRDIFYSFLKRFKGKCTIFLASESDHVMSLADKTIVIKDGQLETVPKAVQPTNT